MSTSSIIDRLKKAGFSDYESRAFAVLLNQDMLTASEIAALAEIPQGRVYSVLQALESRGFCTTFPGAVKRFKVSDPTLAIEEVIHAQAKVVDELEDLKYDLVQLYKEGSASKQSLDFVQMLTSKQSQVSKFDELIKCSRSSLYSFNKKPYATGFLRNLTQIKKDSAPLRKAIKAGVSVRAIFETELEYTEEFARMLKYYSSIGEEVRVSDSLPMKMLLSDNSLAMVSLRNNDVSRWKLTSMIVDHSDLSNALTILFEKFWEESMTLENYLHKYNIESTLN